MYEIEIVLHTDEKPSVQDVLDYINELGEDLDFTVTKDGSYESL
tara:strand:+ start:683 stop:814 length:132 start_codon:yes stop_codon:yes gene_type:complete